jgi:nicotinamidase-related amidase
MEGIILTHKSGPTALLVIDVQQGMFHKTTPVYRRAELLNNINLLIDQAHAAGAPVIFIQHCDARSLVKGTQDWQLHPDLHYGEGDTTVYKQKSNAFEDTNLHQELKSKRIARLVITGMVTHGCVKNTCLGALPLGYETILVEDAHSSFSKQASELIGEWNKTLSEKGAVVVPAARVSFS